MELYHPAQQPLKLRWLFGDEPLAGRRVEESAHLTHDLSQDTAYQPTHLPSNSFLCFGLSLLTLLDALCGCMFYWFPTRISEQAALPWRRVSDPAPRWWSCSTVHQYG